MHRLLERLFTAVDALLAALLAGMVLMVLGNVVLRYAFNSGIVASEELSRVFFVWLTFIGAIVAVREGTHLGMDNVVSRLPRGGQVACLVLSQALIVLCCAVLFWGTWRQHEINATMKTPVTGLPMIWVFGLGYVCSFCIALSSLGRLWRVVTGHLAAAELVQVRNSEEHVPEAAR